MPLRICVSSLTKTILEDLKQALIATELTRNNVDIAAHGETKLTGEGKLCKRSSGCTFFYVTLTASSWCRICYQFITCQQTSWSSKRFKRSTHDNKNTLQGINVFHNCQRKCTYYQPLTLIKLKINYLRMWIWILASRTYQMQTSSSCLKTLVQELVMTV